LRYIDNPACLRGDPAALKYVEMIIDLFPSIRARQPDIHLDYSLHAVILLGVSF
jgi:hypothetical protein